MSINSLCSNPKILNEFINLVNEGIPTDPILTLENQDGNCAVSTVDREGTINLESEITINSLSSSNEIVTDFLENQDELLIKCSDGDNQVLLTIADIKLSVGNNSDITLSNGNLNFTDSKLKTNNMINPFLTDGTNGQVMATDGNNNIIWVDNEQPPSQKSVSCIFQTVFNLTSTSATSITLYSNPAISGFTIGKASIIDISFTYYLSNNDYNSQNLISVTLGDNTSSLLSPLQVIPLFRSPLRFIFQVENTAETQALTITLSSTTPTLNIFTVDQYDYFSCNITQIN